MQALIFSQEFKEKHVPIVEQLIASLREQDVDYLVYQPFYEQAKEALFSDEKPRTIAKTSDFDQHQVDVVITLGGDGTILKAVSLIQDKNIPILGINLGRLGFLASIEKQFVAQCIQELVEKNYTIEERSMISLETSNDIFPAGRIALNDFTLHKRDNSSMVTIHAYINGEFLNTYWADGLIVATPTGSTGYSLSCGGPIIFPNSGNFVITPVAPHNLNVRPIVISDTSVISFEIEGRSENFLATLDSRFETVTAEHELSVRKCSFPTRLIRMPDASFLKTIHEKLAWGKDSRN